ncbi:MAG TPA: folylpolyglutamate synthase/dihydrofolate synthase family protein [Opitutus sp.]|nr:folylpolyglutamate synthase/dihydrofolate synthase family protein [Opitutus sp.]
MMTGDRTDYPAVADYLFGLKPRGTKLGIDRMRPFAAALGNPERDLPCIHIAGTNGKGSVAAMVESILRSAGWRVGLFTSPHLVHLGERVQVDRQPLREGQIVEYIRHLDAVADTIASDGNAEDRPSFFEFMVAVALLEFRRSQCDIAIMEVGLGGEFDATNIVSPEVSVITSIGLDHCEWLGETIPDIARAKAGIIKPLCPVVIGRLPADAERVIRQVAAANSSQVISVREEFGDELVNHPSTNLAGEYQRLNAATASLAASTLSASWRITPEAIVEGLKTISWAGRWQNTTIGGRRVVLDASHNAEGAAVLDANLTALVAETGRAPIVIVGVLGIERAGALMAAICRSAKEIHTVVPDQPRAVTHELLESFVTPDFSGRCIRAAVTQLFPGGDVCTAGGSDDIVVVTGSIYLLGEVLSRIQPSHSPVV